MKRLKRVPTIVYGVQHRFSKLQTGQADVLLADVLKHAQSREPAKGLRHAVALELTPLELRQLVEHPEFGAIEKHFDAAHERGKLQYWRFWHEIVHAFKDYFDLHAIDDQELKDRMDQAFREGKTDEANICFQERSHRTGEKIKVQDVPGQNRYLAALLGLSHLQGNEPQRRTGLYRQLRKKGMAVRWFESINREGRTKFSVMNY